MCQRRAVRQAHNVLNVLGCMRVMADQEQVRVPVLFPKEELAALDDWQFANRVKTRSEAIRELVRRGVSKTAER